MKQRRKYILLTLTIALLVMAIAGCSAGSPEATTTLHGDPEPSAINVAGGVTREVPVVVEREVMKQVVAEAAVFSGGSPQFTAGTDLQVADRKVISTASISLEVEVVPGAIAAVRVIAESLGGFVEQMSSFGNMENQQATITIRIPQDRFFSALDRLSELGEVRSQSVGSEDVSEQFIDMGARLKSALREEESLLSLLDKARLVSEILTIERELSRVRSEIERLQGRLNFLERRVELATISISLFSPGVEVGEPPSASLTIESSDVTGSVETVKALVKTLNGKIDKVFISVQDGRESALMTLRVLAPDFDSALDTIENMGDVRSKRLEEGTTPREVDAETSEDPNARIDLSLVEKEGGVNTGLIVAIAAPIGGTFLALLLALLFYVIYRAGQRRGRTV